MKVTYFGKPKRDVEVIYYILYVSVEKGKRSKWAGECSERIEIDNRLKRYFVNNNYVSAKVICKFDGGEYVEYIKT